MQPITIREAKVFVRNHHRHHKAPTGALFALALNDGERVVAVALVGRPVAEAEQDGWTAEVLRVCALEGHMGACSKLYTAAKRAAQAQGYRRVLTRILLSEPGTSLRAAGWKKTKERCGGGPWSRKSRPRVDTHPQGEKQLWDAV